MNVLLLVVTVLGVGALVLGAIIALVGGAPARAGIIAAIAGGWLSAYVVLVVGASLTSHDALLAPGQTKRFCGFYLDCHVGVAVVSDTVTLTPALVQHLVKLHFSSDARRETLSPWHVQAFLQGAGGTRYPASDPLGGKALEQPIAAGAGYDVSLRFDVPRDESQVRLMVRQGGDLLFPELLLIGDEASLLHRKTWLALPAIIAG